MNRLWILGLLTLLVVRLSVSPAEAATYYVATTGNDSAAGIPLSPFKTIAKGFSVVSAGETLYVRGGTYAVNLGGSTTLPSGTSWSNAIHVSAYPTETVILVTASGDPTLALLDPAHGEHYQIWTNIVFDGTNVTFAIGGNNTPHHFRLLNCEVKNALGSGVLPHGDYWEFIHCNVHHNGSHTTANVPQDHGYYLSGSYNLIDGGSSHDNWGLGIQVFESAGTARNGNIVRNVRVYGNGVGNPAGGAGGIILSSGEGNLAYNNVSFHNYGTGITIAESGYSNNGALYNNTAYGNSGYGILVGGNAWGSLVKNNISYGNGGSDIHDNGTGTGTLLSNNLTTDPKFLDTLTGDFHLQSNSSAVNGGADLSSVFTTDIDGLSRPQGPAYDIGAYEYAAASSLRRQHLPAQKTLGIYPNPSGGLVSFVRPAGFEKAAVYILNISGGNVAQLRAGETTWSSSGSAKGIYLVKINGPNGAVAQKLILW